MLDPYPFRLFPNPRSGTPGIVVLPEAGFRRAKAEITSWPGYAPTPLRRFAGDRRQTPAIARAAAQGRSEPLRPRQLQGARRRLCRRAFAAARNSRGAASPVTPPRRISWTANTREATRNITVTCATDGNHGRSVAWGAQRFGCRCVIFVHATVSPGRVAAIERYGAEVRRVPGIYDDAVREATRVAAAEHWFIVSDTSWEGYTEVPRRGHAGLPPDGRRGRRPVAGPAADARLRAGRRRRRGRRGLGADARPLSRRRPS